MVNSGESLALSIVRRLQAAGYVAYYAGGCVRDRLMGRAPADYDVATSARPEQVLGLFPRSQKVGAAFGVILVRERMPGQGREEAAAQVEVATFRADGTYSDGRHPDSVEFTTPQRDAQRRDFTCNGLFFDPVADGGGGGGGGAGMLHDFVGGQADIAARVLRAIGDPAARFREDHLRMLRAVRFAARLEFTIEAATFLAMQALAGEIRTISRERIHDELEMILGSPSRGVAGELLQRLGLLRHLWPPELFAKPDDPRRWKALRGLPADADFVAGLIAMHLDIASAPSESPRDASAAAPVDGSAVAALLRRELLLSNAESADLAWLLDQSQTLLGWQSLAKAPLKRLLADPRWPRLSMLFLSHGLDPALRESFEQRVKGLQAEGVAPIPLVTGDALIGMGALPGPAFKRWLEELYDRQLNNEFPSAAEAVVAARQLVVSHARAP